MAGETILIVEDAPENLKTTAGALRSEGYRVQIASSAEQALSALRFLQPNLMLVDFILPGMSGLELIAKVKHDVRLHNTLVVALSGRRLPDDPERAREAGCDGYLTKPMPIRVLAARVRGFLDYGSDLDFMAGTEAPRENTSARPIGMPQEDIEQLQENFLKAGKSLSRQLVLSVDDNFDAARASRTVHQWIGTATMLGCPNVAARARDVDSLLRNPNARASQLRAPLTHLARAFHQPKAVGADTISPIAVKHLQGKRVALVGLSSDEADTFCGVLEQVGAKALLFSSDQSPYADAVAMCQLAVVYVAADYAECRWLAPDAPNLPELATLFVGAPENLVRLSPKVQARAGGLLAEGSLNDEVILRLRLLMTHPHSAPPIVLEEGAELVIADSEPANRETVRKRLEDYGLRCRMASNGPDAILQLQQYKPAAMVVDVNMDGFEILAMVHAGNLKVRTIFLSHQLTENEVMRGLQLGAEDFLAQPFSPVELAARLKRLVA